MTKGALTRMGRGREGSPSCATGTQDERGSREERQGERQGEGERWSQGVGEGQGGDCRKL